MEHCPDCGGLLSPADDRCWLCHWRRPKKPAGSAPDQAAITLATLAKTPGEGRPCPQYPDRTHLQFSLATLLLIMTLTSVLCGLIAAAPGLGIPIAVLSVPALVRTCITASRRQKRGEAMPFEEKASTFVVTVVLGGALLATTAVVFGITFFVVCLATGGGIDSEESPVTYVAAVVVAAAVFIGLLVLWYRVARRRRRRKVGPIPPFRGPSR
jgi:O-antigen/teichoic acid export membrane protein